MTSLHPTAIRIATQNLPPVKHLIADRVDLSPGWLVNLGRAKDKHVNINMQNTKGRSKKTFVYTVPSYLDFVFFKIFKKNYFNSQKLP